MSIKSTKKISDQVNSKRAKSNSKTQLSSSILDKIAEIEQELSRMQRNKATEKSSAVLKSRLSKLRSQYITEMTKKSGGGEGTGFEVRKVASSICRAGLIGFPSVGKSTLMSRVTKTKSEVAAYEFTTLTCVPGIIDYESARIQLLDLPGIIEGAGGASGRQKNVLSVARTCDVILIILDAAKADFQIPRVHNELNKTAIRLNQSPPNIFFKKTSHSGVRYNSLCRQSILTAQIVKSICKEYKIHHAEILVKEDSTIDRLIDVIEGNRVYCKAIYVYNRIDLVSMEFVNKIARRPNSVVISSSLNLGIDNLLAVLWKTLKFNRIYTKPHGERPDFSEPFLLPAGATIRSICRKIHASVLEDFNYAMVWGASVKHSPTRVSLDHVLADQDVIQIMTN